MTLHKVTLLLDDEWFDALNRFTQEVYPEETCMMLMYTSIDPVKCPTCGHDTPEGDLIPCTGCGNGLCYWCQDNPDFPCPALESKE